MKKIISSIIWIIAFISCKQESLPPIQGHWHSIGNAQPGVYQTLDISDTNSILDQHIISGMKYNSFPLKEGNDLILPTFFTFYSNDIRFLEDTLIIEKEFKYKRVTDCQLQEDLFSNLFIKVELTEEVGDLELESLQEHFHTAFISVGKLKDGIVYKSSSGDYISSDDYFIQINDVLPGPEYIPAFILTEYNAAVDKNGLAIIINIDKNVPENLSRNILELMDQVDVPYAKFQAVWNKENRKPFFKRI